MIMYVTNAIFSGKLTKAVPIHSFGYEFDTEETSDEVPSGDGIHRLHDSSVADSAQIVAWPYCLGCAGSTWMMRVSGWWAIGNDPNTQVWLRNILSVVTCVAGRQRGYKGRLLNEEERLALSSFVVPTLGAQLIQFEFMCQLTPTRFGMNAYWAKA